MFPRIGDAVTLDDGEQMVCKVLAKLRHQNNRKEAVKNSRIGGQSDEATDLEGIGSELAFSKLWNLYPDLSIFIRSSLKGEDEGDNILHTGQSVDVKATRYATGKLVAVPWKKMKVDLFALMVGVFPKYTFKGFMRSEELLQEKRLGTLGHGPTYIAYQNELRDIDKLDEPIVPVEVAVKPKLELFEDEALKNL